MAHFCTGHGYRALEGMRVPCLTDAGEPLESHKRCIFAQTGMILRNNQCGPKKWIRSSGAERRRVRSAVGAAGTMWCAAVRCVVTSRCSAATVRFDDIHVGG